MSDTITYPDGTIGKWNPKFKQVIFQSKPPSLPFNFESKGFPIDQTPTLEDQVMMLLKDSKAFRLFIQERIDTTDQTLLNYTNED